MRFLSILAKSGFAMFVISALIGASAALGTRLGLFDYHLSLLKIFPWCVFAGLGGLAASFLWAVIALFGNSGAGARYGVVALLGSGFIVWTPLSYIATARTVPPIHDISTDVMDAPKFEALVPLRRGAETPARYDGPDRMTYHGRHATVATLQKIYYSDIHPSAILTKVDVLYWRAFFAVKKMGWHLVAFDAKRGRIEATTKTFWFGFTHDIVIRVRPSGLGARLDIRAKSRIDGPDFGYDADLIRSYFKTLARK